LCVQHGQAAAAAHKAAPTLASGALNAIAAIANLALIRSILILMEVIII
jgi:hypothetical protein